MAVLAQVAVPLALVYQADALHRHLKQALSELGANVVYEAHVREFERAKLDASGAAVIVINLDPEATDDLEAIDELLVDETRRVVFNDGEVSSTLEGWDLARWTRHLAAKVLGQTDVNPPRPAGAEAIPVRVHAMPGAGASASNADDFELGGAELAAALAADIGAVLQRERAALTTTEEPIHADLVAKPSGNETYEVDATELEMHLPPRIEEPTLEAPASSDATTLEIPLPSNERPTLELAFDASAMPAGDQLSFDVVDVGDVPDTLGDDLDFSALDAVDLPQGNFASMAAEEPPPAEDDFAAAMADFGFLEDAPHEPRGEVVPDLDALLRGEGSVPQVASAVVAGKAASAASLEAKPSVDATSFDAAAARPATTEPKKERSLADLESALSKFALVDDDAPLEAPAAAVAPPVPAKAEEPAAPPAKSSLFDTLTLSLEPLDGEEPQVPITGRAQFELGKDATPVAPPPVVEVVENVVATPIDDPADDGLSVDGIDFDFDPDAEIKADSIVRMGSEPALDDLAVDLDSEIESLLRDAAGITGEVKPRIRRVWVLGASIGGPDAVREFLGALPADVPALFLLAQHMGADFLDLMVQQLAKATPLKVRSVSHGDVVNPGEVLIVPLTRRLEVDRDGAAKVSALAEPSPYTPSIDQAMKDAADRFGADAGAIIFSGMAHDAIEGAQYLKQKGGTVWVQDPSSCVISSMVDGALEAGVVSYQGKPAELARRFLAEISK